MEKWPVKTNFRDIVAEFGKFSITVENVKCYFIIFIIMDVFKVFYFGK